MTEIIGSSGNSASASGGCGSCAISSLTSSCSGCGPGGSSTGSNSQVQSPSFHTSSGNRRRSGEEGVTRRSMLKYLFGAGAAATGASLFGGSGLMSMASGPDNRASNDAEFFEKNYRLMTEGEKRRRIERLEKRYRKERGVNTDISDSDAIPGVLYGYAFNISKCQGYRDCVRGCIEENNLDRESGMQYIRIFEKEQASGFGIEDGDASYFHQVPAEGHFYVGTQCFQCENPPCVEVCPVGATWKEPDGIVVVDYDWCIGCRYCQAACPYWARRFNWSEPQIPASEVNSDQHYLGNRIRPKGVMEKCTFCIQRSRSGELPACVEACPTGARVFGNLLDPDSEIRYILENKKVFRLKEDLNTEPKFWYYMD